MRSHMRMVLSVFALLSYILVDGCSTHGFEADPSSGNGDSVVEDDLGTDYDGPPKILREKPGEQYKYYNTSDPKTWKVNEITAEKRGVVVGTANTPGVTPIPTRTNTIQIRRSLGDVSTAQIDQALPGTKGTFGPRCPEGEGSIANYRQC